MDGFVALALAALLLLVGIAHLVVRRKVEPLVPEWWPAPRATVLFTGVLEIALGIGLILGDLRGPAAAPAALLFLGYTVVPLDDLRHAGTATRFSDRVPGVLFRGLANLAYAGCALYVAQGRWRDGGGTQLLPWWTRNTLSGSTARLIAASRRTSCGR